MNHAETIIESLREEIERSQDLESSVRNHSWDFLEFVGCRPMDAGIRKIRNFSFYRPKNPGQTAGENENWLLCVRGIDDNGDDVVSFTSAESIEGTLLDYVYASTSKSVEWKPDEKRTDRNGKRSFMDSLADGVQRRPTSSKNSSK